MSKLIFFFATASIWFKKKLQQEDIDSIKYISTTLWLTIFMWLKVSDSLVANYYRPMVRIVIRVPITLTEGIELSSQLLVFQKQKLIPIGNDWSLKPLEFETVRLVKIIFHRKIYTPFYIPTFKCLLQSNRIFYR